MRRSIWVGMVLLAFTGDLIAAPIAVPLAKTQAASPLVPSDEPAAPLHAPKRESLDAMPDISLADKGMFVGEEIKAKRNVTLIAAESDLQQRHTSKLLIGKRGRAIPVQTIQFSRGRVDAILTQQYQERGVLLQAGRIQALTKSGRIAASIVNDQVAVAALQGDALVGQSGSFKKLAEGQVRVFNLVSNRNTDRARLDAPTLKSGALAVALDGGEALKISASKVEGAMGYRTVLLDQHGASVGPVVESTDPQNLVAHAPHAGTYYAIVRAVDEFGLAGVASQAIRLRVLGLTNEKEVLRHGMIFLAPGQSAQLAGHEGLIMRYGSSPDFIPAPHSISLPSRRATVVEFRDPKRPDQFAVFRLAPRVLKSTLELGPADSTWPSTPTQMRVSMWDGHGEPLAWMDEFDIIVKVNLDIVQVDWQKDNDDLVAELPPQNGKGPWVVRLSVMDPAGGEIARNMLEVVPDRPRNRDVTNASKGGVAQASLPGKH